LSTALIHRATQSSDKSAAAPKLNVVVAGQPRGLRDGLCVINADQRLESQKVPPLQVR
jgi:hypothetical protein